MSNTSHPMRALVGQLIDRRYHILRELGSEELSWVYLARDCQQNEQLTKLKVLQPQLADRAPQRQRFLAEARLQESLWHPSVAKILAIQETDAHVYIAMEWLEGETLGELAKRFGSPFGIDAVIKLVQPIGKTVEYAHNTQIIHHNINPDTIEIDWSQEFLEIKVTGFSLPLAPGTRQHSDTMTAAMLRNAAYISPEQAADTGQVDHRTDVYSLGACIYLLATGRPPFVGDYHQVLQQLLKGEFRHPCEVATTCPPVLADVILKCMAKSPDARFQSIQEVLDELTKLRPFAAGREHIEIIGLRPPPKKPGGKPKENTKQPNLRAKPEPQRRAPAARRPPAGSSSNLGKFALPAAALLLLALLGGGLWLYLGPGGKCKEGATRACYTGPAGTKDRGRCREGQQTCTSGAFGECEKQVTPAANEVCNGKDDDCDGKIDNAAAYAKLGKACLAHEGACLTPGHLVCAESGVALRCRANHKPKEGWKPKQLDLILLPEKQPITIYWRGKPHKAKGLFCIPKPKRRRSTVVLRSKGYHPCRLRLRRKHWNKSTLTLELKRRRQGAIPLRRTYCMQ